MPEKKNFIGSEKFWFLLFVLISAAGIAVNITYCFYKPITYDSSYQYFLTLHSWKEIWRLLPEDYSPPLYALLLKLICVLFGHTLHVMRYANSLVIAGFVFLALFPVRKAFGAKTGFVAAAGFICSSVNSFLFTEVRPTFLACFLLTGAAVYAYLAFFEGKRRYYVCHAVFSLLSMYTHNVGMIGALGLYALVLLFSIVKKDKKRAISFVASGMICALLYIPWLLVVFKQFGNVEDHYWKGRYYSLNEIKEYCVNSIIYFNAPQIVNSVIENSLSLLFKLLIVFYIIKNLNIKSIRKISDIKNAPLFGREKRMAHFKGVFVVLLFVFPLLAFEITVRVLYPFAAMRYYLIFTGTVILVLSVFFSKTEKKAVPFICIAALTVNMAVVNRDTISSLKSTRTLDLVEAVKEEQPDGNICFLHSNEFTLGIMSYYFPDAKHYIHDGTWTVLNDMSVFSTDPVNIHSIDDIREYTDSFYTFAPVFPNDETDLIEYFGNAADCTCGRRKRYEYPMSVTISRVEFDNTGKK